jgi:hypothetical protein
LSRRERHWRDAIAPLEAPRVVMAPVEKTGLYHPRGLSARTSSGERGGEGAAIHRKGSNDTRESWGVEMQGYDRLGCGLPDEDDETESKEISHGETSSMGVTFNLCNAILGEDPCRGVAQALCHQVFGNCGAT